MAKTLGKAIGRCFFFCAFWILAAARVKMLEAFTDEDLKRLMKLIDDYDAEGRTACYSCARFREDSKALFTRLEAAELSLECYHDEYGAPIEVSHEYHQWRKAAGK